MTNTRNMTAPRRCDTQWEQTIQIDRRRAPRTPTSPKRGPRERREREPINWGLVLMLAGAGFLVVAVWAYKLAGPSL
jgi:hypothetical protein